MCSDGFLMLPNHYFETNYWKDKFKVKLDKGDAVIDLLQQMRYGDGTHKVSINGYNVIINKGEKVASYGYLARRWRWSKSTVYRFIEDLCEAKILCKREDNGITILAVSTMDRAGTANGTAKRTPNYTDNQEVTSSSGTTNRTAYRTNKNTEEKEYNNLKNIYMINSNLNINKKWLSIDIASRNKLFKEIISEKYATKYDSAMIEEFILYWAYFEEGDDTMRFEEVKGKKFHIGRRLATWYSNYKKRNTFKPRATKTLDFDKNNSWARLDLSNINYEE